MPKKLFPSHAFTACKNCAHGRLSQDGSRVFCPRKGVVNPDFACRKYRYNPLRRVPRRPPELLTFDEKEFKL